MQYLNITTIQTHLHWENTEKNVQHFTQLIHTINEPTDVIVLPEMFTTGFTMQPNTFAEEHEGQGLQWMKEMAHVKNACITGSISVKQNEKNYNRLYWVFPNGDYKTYDKHHLFSMGKEHEHYSAGQSKLIVEVNGWKICPMICYDLRFPVWSRNTWSLNKQQELVADYDVLIYVANWPEGRVYPWRQLLIARSIENQAYVVGVNRIGEDGNGVKHSGDSLVINPRGEIVNKTLANENRIETVELNYTYLEEFRKLFPVGADADSFSINLLGK